MKKIFKLIILSIIVLLSLIPEITGIYREFGVNYNYIIKPLIWCFIAIITLVFFRNDVITDNSHKKEVTNYVIISALIYFLLYFVVGYVNGFKYNPYDSSVLGILFNVWTFLPILVTKEYIRYYIINNVGKKHIYVSAILVSLLFLLLDINLFKIGDYFSSSYMFMKFILESFIPALAINLYLTYICYYASYRASIIYLFVPKMFLYILPILPDLNWILLAVLDTGMAFFSYVFINYRINKLEKTVESRKKKVVGLKGWILMILFVFVMIGFGLGLFSYKPLVIATNSMYPKIRKGDIVLIKDIDPNKLKRGDIIRYELEDYYVVHRIKEINQDKYGNRLFIMKGDNNNTVDLYPVSNSQVKGVIKFNIPYAGYPTLLFNRLLNIGLEDKVNIETGK